MEQCDIAFRHSKLSDRVIDLVSEQQGIIICRSDILGSEAQEPPRQVQGILSPHEHPLDPVTSSITIAITKRFMDGGDDIIMFLAIPIEIDGLLSCLQDDLIADCAIFCEKESRFEDIQGVTEISVAKFADKKDMIIGQGDGRMFFEDQRELFLDESEYLLISEFFEHEDSAPAEQRIIDGEARILGGCADEDDGAFLYIGQKRILLGFIPAVDFIQENDGRFAVLEIDLGLIDQFEQILFLAGDSREIEEIRMQGL